MSYQCPVCEKMWPDTMELARHVFGVGDHAHKDWVNAQGVNFIELLLLQTMEPGNKGYKALAEILERKAKKVGEKT